MEIKFVLILVLISGLNYPKGAEAQKKAPDDGVFVGEGCDKMQYIKSNFDCPAPGIFAITRNCVDFIICVPNAFNEYDDFFTSCELPYQYHAGNGQCINATVAGNERENCPQMDCKIVPASEAVKPSTATANAHALTNNAGVHVLIVITSTCMLRLAFVTK